jgi:glutamate dehydrogenase (NAD(P)+)
MAMPDVFALADSLGPKKVVHLYEPSVSLRAILVIDNTACGPAVGGVRMAPDVGLEECSRLARAMTMKNAAAGLPHGGGKSVILGDPKMPTGDKEKLIRAFAGAIRDLVDYIPGPDMGTDERCMAWVKDEIGRVAGLPRELGGIPLDQVGATGFGIMIAATVAEAEGYVTLKGARVAIQGFGAVGKNAARFLAEKGALLVAASDSQGTVIDPQGIDVARLVAWKQEGRSVRDYPGARKAGPEAVIDAECEIWIPAARPDVIRKENVDRLKARLVLQGANIPMTAEAEAVLHRRGVINVPDFIVNAGGVICAAVEIRGGTTADAFRSIEERIRANTAEVLAAARKGDILPREAAIAMAERRVRAAMTYRRWG